MSTDNKKLKICPKITETSVTEKGEIRIQWTESPGADKYAVKRSESPDGEYELVAWAKGTVYIDISVKNHLICFAAEKSRKLKKVIDVDEVFNEYNI